MEEEARRFKEVYLQKKIDSLRAFTKDYKQAIDECSPAGISSESMSIGILRTFLEGESKYLTRVQEEEIDNLKREYAIQFQRLTIGKVCECHSKVKK
jgi:hypothetical protein